jgi:hypothetical protein
MKSLLVSMCVLMALEGVGQTKDKTASNATNYTVAIIADSMPRNLISNEALLKKISTDLNVGITTGKRPSGFVFITVEFIVTATGEITHVRITSPENAKFNEQNHQLCMDFRKTFLKYAKYSVGSTGGKKLDVQTSISFYMKP